MFTKKQLELIELLKEMTIKEACIELNINRGAADKRLHGIRNKIEKARRISSVATSWMKHKRLGKLLRRQELKNRDYDE